MRKVLMIPGPWHPVPPLKGAAVESIIYELCKNIFLFETHIVSIKTPFHERIEYRDGIFFHRLHFSELYIRIFKKFLGVDPLSYNYRTVKLIKKINPEVVHIHNYVDGLEIIKKIKEWNSEIKTIFHAHNIFSHKIDIIKKYIKYVDGWLGCSNFVTEYYKNLLQSKNPNCLYGTIYNGVDLKKYQKRHLKEKIGNRKINIVFVGRIAPDKGVINFIKLAELFRKDSRFQFICAGEISKKGDKGKYFLKLMEYINEKDIKNVKFLGCIVPDKMHLFYKLADIVVMPSAFEEPFPMVALETMASGIPLIATQKGGLRELIKNNKNGFLVKKIDKFEEEAKEIITNLINNQDVYGKISNEAVKTIKENFLWEKISWDLSNYYMNWECPPNCVNLK